MNLDDLLPENPAYYDPPEDLRNMFVHGTPIFDFSENWFYILKPNIQEEYRDQARIFFELGIYWVMIRSGVAFKTFTMPTDEANALELLAKSYRRTVERTEVEDVLGNKCLILEIGSHAERVGD